MVIKITLFGFSLELQPNKNIKTTKAQKNLRVFCRFVVNLELRVEAGAEDFRDTIFP